MYPYLLGDLEIGGPKEVWCADITYTPLQRGLMYLVAIMNWFSRYVLAWELSNTQEAWFCVQALERALGLDRPGIFNTDPGGGVHGLSGTSWGTDQHGWSGSSGCRPA